MMASLAAAGLRAPLLAARRRAAPAASTVPRARCSAPQRVPRRRHHLRVAASSGAGDAAAPASEPPLATLCGLLSVLTAAKGAVGALAPAKMLEAALGASAVTPETTALMGAVAAVSWIVAAWLAALRDAVLHGRLASDTYKRLALCLGYVALLLGVALLRFHSVVPAASLAAACVSLPCVALICGHIYQIGSGSTVWADRVKIVKGALGGLASCVTTRPANAYSFFYALQALSCAALFLWLFPTHATPLFPGGLPPAGDYLTRASAACLVAVGATAFTLKDAADRGRLGASTFRLLNLASAAAVAQQVWYFWSLKGAGAGALALPLLHAIVAQGVVMVVVHDVAYLRAKK